MPMPEPHDENTPPTGDELLSQELGMDVDLIELQLKLRIDIARIQRGEPSELGYLLIDRQHHPDAAVVYLTPEAARTAFEDDANLLISSLCEEDCLDATVPDIVTSAELTGREIILP